MNDFLWFSPLLFVVAKLATKAVVSTPFRVTHDISLWDSTPGLIPDNVLSRRQICGILGMVRVGTGPAIIVARTKTKVGIDMKDILRKAPNNFIHRLASTAPTWTASTNWRMPRS